LGRFLGQGGEGLRGAYTAWARREDLRANTARPHGTTNSRRWFSLARGSCDWSVSSTRESSGSGVRSPRNCPPASGPCRRTWSCPRPGGPPGGERRETLPQEPRRVRLPIALARLPHLFAVPLVLDPPHAAAAMLSGRRRVGRPEDAPLAPAPHRGLPFFPSCASR